MRKRCLLYKKEKEDKLILSYQENHAEHTYSELKLRQKQSISEISRTGLEK
jgi:hypothetical protein